jgi:CheY-like chemotaxis protein
MTRILVVDDEQDLVWAIRHSLSTEGRDFLLIEPDPTHPIYIHTVPHHGYTFERRKASPNATPT